ncbi:unnamed protein product [Caenorhabditis angaria]|uniref:FYVE-type domain-containing protein n=1 Tax=Caenorhabditis angaria TaxID=860376 RepID=A0A9P1IN11_9PELO|nr:unnamed protein product [Caenorhabditis angaria]
MDDVVRQGFICPFCMEDFGDFERLQRHVDDEHSENADDGDITDAVVQNVRGLFDKAKRGIKKLDAKISISELPTEVTRPLVRSGPPRPLPPDVIPRGITRSSTNEFRKLRDESINESAIRTNMLIIRLDRLINGGPKDPSKRREFEREIVPWLDDEDVVCCPLCAAKFGLTRRKHHCRLCGRVLCHNCSQFLSFLSARKLTNPAIAFQMQESLASLNSDAVENIPKSSKQKLISITQQSMDRMKNLIGKVQTVTTGDDVSVSSLLQQEATECLRVCGSCLNDLHRRENMMEQGKAPAIVEQYDHLRNCVGELKQLVPTYVRLATSINNGETMYTLKSAEEMRQKCLEKQRHVDVMSKRIAEESEDCGIREQQMRRNIRATTLQVLQGLIGQTTSLPSVEEYAKLVRKHKEEVAKQVQAARERSQLASDRILKASTSMPLIASNSSNNPSTSSLSSLNSSKSPPTRKTPEVDDGWVPQQSKSFNPFLEDDESINSVNSPLIEQRDQIRGFLAQAASAGKLDEVEMLERNLKEIEEIIRNIGLE